MMRMLELYISLFILIRWNDANSPGPNDKTYVHGCYFTHWSPLRYKEGKYSPEKYVPGLCSHIFYAYATVNDDFEIEPIVPGDVPNLSDPKGMFGRVMDLKKKQIDLKILLSFGGYTVSTKKKKLLRRMISNEASRKKFAQSAKNFTATYGFDGFNMHWEYPGIEEKVDFSLLIQEISRQLRSNKFLVTATVAPHPWQIEAGYDVSLLAKNLDFIDIRSFDLHGFWEPETGLNSPLFDRDHDNISMNTAAEHWFSKGMPKNKILIGLAAFGRSYDLIDSNDSNIGSKALKGTHGRFTKTAGFLSYFEICEHMEIGGKCYMDQEQKTPYYVRDNIWIGYDNVESFRIKLKWLKEKNYAGAVVWSLDLDDFNGFCRWSSGEKYPLIRQVAQELSGKPDQYAIKSSEPMCCRSENRVNCNTIPENKNLNMSERIV